MAVAFRDQRFVVVDVETSGFSPRVESVIEIGVSVHQGGHEVRSFSSLIGPWQPVPPIITKITGIRSDDLRKAPLFSEVVNSVAACFGGADFFVAHNVDFDRSFLEVGFAECRRDLPPLPWVDPVPLARKLLGFGKLEKVAAHYAVEHKDAHAALDDARVTAEVLYRLADDLRLTTLVELLSGTPAPAETSPPGPLSTGARRLAVERGSPSSSLASPAASASAPDALENAAAKRLKLFK